MKDVIQSLQELSFDDLELWAGGKILQRGKGYVKQVEQLAQFGEHTLCAWVTGGQRYATSVTFDPAGELSHSCTCPYDWGPCKHAVALILAAALRIKSKRSIPSLDPTSELGETMLDEPDADRPDDAAPTQNEIIKLLADKDPEELTRLILDLATRFPNVARHIRESAQLTSGQVSGVVRGLKKEIRKLTAEPAWYDHWRHEGDLPDYSHLCGRLQALADQGHADALLKLGEELWTRGIGQVEQSDDEGETAMAIAECLHIVVQALPQTSLDPSAQLLWLLEHMLEDEYSLLDCAEEMLNHPAYSTEHWRQVAGVLEQRLSKLPSPRNSDSHRYRRNHLVQQLLDAYRRAEYPQKIIPRLEAEADACQCYTELVDELLSADQQERARHWCIQGYARTAKHTPGIASALQKKLRQMAESAGRHGLVAAYCAQDFFQRPSVSDYEELRAAAARAQCWPTVRSSILHYLESGRLPEPVNGENWPLPAPEVGPQTLEEYSRNKRFPNLETLIDIAILEQRLDDVVALHQQLGQRKYRLRDTDKKVAKVVADTHPDLALSIWKKIAEGLIAEVKPRAYVEAATYLRLMQKVYVKTQRQEEWQTLLNNLRTQHKAKRRLLEVLDGLSGKKIVD